ncbi:helix-turn-helix domain-containing protein [Roseomonas sp. SSH11]|uniref:Helix-turn-helix domain-containing protein n=1 Tax=Pararoseomonas baculiformis TaxID=2820812 RepID=A0ABS4AAS5_9PROT|nr:helix-turn-helix domain-containing protein [Pararoseomonas baculiformis]MBP0444102.1 helix-turn-helix domain-containing protein [Pararoseomonas baculiformis]
MELPIGALSRLTGVKVPTIRYYEEIGLLPAAPRTDSNRRSYGETAVRRLRFIRHARDLGFEVEAIRQLLALADDPDRPCAEVDGIARTHLAEIDDRIARLTSLRAEISRMTESCAHGRVGECRVIRVLADHGLCAQPQH